jgi:hypothetical protein
MTDRHIVLNRIITPDGTVLESEHVHDYKTYIDTNGLEYMVDGGREYLRRNEYDDDPYTEATVYTDSPFEELREVVTWGTYGKSGKEPMRRRRLSELSDDHIKAILETQRHIKVWLCRVFEEELTYRFDNDIKIEDTK